MDKKQVTKLFDQLVEKIEAQEWFTEEWGTYRDGNYLHIFKNNWHEERHNGVHFETYVGDTELEHGKFPVLIHAEKDVPHRDRFVIEVVSAIKDQLPAHMCGVNEYTVYREMLDFDPATFVDDVVSALEALQLVVPIIDMCLENNSE